jgi:hypothetical protein
MSRVSTKRLQDHVELDRMGGHAEAGDFLLMAIGQEIPPSPLIRSKLSVDSFPSGELQ